MMKQPKGMTMPKGTAPTAKTPKEKSTGKRQPRGK
jgi:hypothetical protein